VTATPGGPPLRSARDPAGSLPLDRAGRDEGADAVRPRCPRRAALALPQRWIVRPHEWRGPGRREVRARLALSGRRHGLDRALRSEEHTSELQSLTNLVCRLLLEKKKKIQNKSKSEINS